MHARVALAATPVTLHGGDHGTIFDAFIVRGKREERRREGCPWGPNVAMPPLTFAGTGVALVSLDNAAGPHTAYRLGVDDEVDRRA